MIRTTKKRFDIFCLTLLCSVIILSVFLIFNKTFNIAQAFSNSINFESNGGTKVESLNFENQYDKETTVIDDKAENYSIFSKSLILIMMVT